VVIRVSRFYRGNFMYLLLTNFLNVYCGLVYLLLTDFLNVYSGLSIDGNCARKIV
jgi:hypothetical protein